MFATRCTRPLFRQAGALRLRKVNCSTSTEDAAKKAATSFGVRNVFSSASFQRFIRVGRVVFVSAMIYQVGFQNGMVHFAQDPQRMEEELMKLSLGIDQTEKIEDHIHSEYSPMFKRVRKIGDRIIAAGREHCKIQRNAAQDALKNLKSGEQETKIQLQMEVAKWEQACRRLEGRWSIILCKSPQVNAFVSGFAPRKVFVFEGLVNQLKPTDDELAMILGHELSHVILGHIEEQTPWTAILFGTQLVLMALVDPIGIFSFGFDIAIAYLRSFIQASFSREHEFEADELGLLLTSLACFDIKAGAHVHEKLAELSHHRATHLNDTHPSSVERKRILSQLAMDHEKDRVTNPIFSQFHRDCIAQREAWHRAIWGTKK